MSHRKEPVTTIGRRTAGQTRVFIHHTLRKELRLREVKFFTGGQTIN